MDKTTLTVIMILLLILLIPLVGTLVFPKKDKQKPKSKPAAPSQGARKKGPRSFDELRKAIKNKESSTADLKEALNELLLHYGKIPDKLGARSHPDFDYYREVLFSACRHRNIDKDTLLEFDKGLRQKNPQYSPQIDEAIKGGLESRAG